MSKVFLSHSSEDKQWYVSIVYKKLVKSLGEQSVIIDNVNFQEGRKTIEEIYYQMGTMDLFVIFLSEKALASPWVQNELCEVGNIIEDGKKQQICPIIIDSRIHYDDERIPEWMQEAYNIQLIYSQTKAANIIRQRMIEISYEKHPHLKERNLLFVGRNDFLKEIEERIDDFDLEKPVAIIASGLEGVGRRTFLKKSIFKSNIVKETYPFSSIVLKSDESIEDCILRLYDLGFCDSVNIEMTQLNGISVDEKISILTEIVVCLQNMQEIVVIVDNGCIVSHEGELACWFEEAVSSSEVQEKITFLLASKFRCFIKDYRVNSIYNVSLPELDIKERSGLLKRCLDIENIELDIEKLKEMSGLLSGLPEQVFFAVGLLRQAGWEGMKKNNTDIISFNSKKANIMLSDIKNDDEKMEFLSLIASFDYISVSYILSVSGSEKKYTDYIGEFYSMGICEYVGTLKEYIRVNDTIKDYIQRSEYRVSKKHELALKQNVNEFINQIAEKDYDIPELLYSLKVSLLNGIEIDEKYIIPSIYLKTMNELYYNGKNKEVIEFADRALLNSSFMDDRIVFEIRYLLCSSLAKLRDQRFLKEVMFIDGADHNFLFGFYYRQIGKFDKALERINNSLEQRNNFSKAKREKVQIYIGMQEYEAALELAKMNYQNYKDNAYHIQAYFTCIIKSDNYPEKKVILQELIFNMENIGSKLSKELTLRLKAQYSAFVENEYEKALGLIEQAIEMNKSIYYARLVKFDIAERFDDIDSMIEIKNYFKAPELKQRYHDNIVCMEAIIKAKCGECREAIEYFTSNIKNYTDQAKDRFIVRLNKYVKA